MGLPYGEEIIIVGRTMWTQSTSVTDSQTDRRTDRITITKTVQRRASHGKKSLCLFICLSVCGRWPAERLGRSRPNLAWGLSLTQGVLYARSRSRSFGATWRMLIKLLTEARKGQENSNIWRHLVNANSLQRPTRAERIKYGGQRPAGLTQ